MGKQREETVHIADNGNYVVSLPISVRKNPSAELKLGLKKAKSLNDSVAGRLQKSK